MSHLFNISEAVNDYKAMAVRCRLFMSLGDAFKYQYLSFHLVFMKIGDKHMDKHSDRKKIVPVRLTTYDVCKCPVCEVCLMHMTY